MFSFDHLTYFPPRSSFNRETLYVNEALCLCIVNHLTYYKAPQLEDWGLPLVLETTAQQFMIQNCSITVYYLTLDTHSYSEKSRLLLAIRQRGKKRFPEVRNPPINKKQHCPSNL